MRLFGRAAVRAGLPLRYTEGFNPQVRVLLPLPRPVGMAADDEVLILELASEVAGETILERLAAQVPAGVEIRSGAVLEGRHLPRARSATYELEASGPMASGLPARIDALLSREQVIVERRRADGTPVKEIDIRPYLLELRHEGEHLLMRLGIDPRGTARVEEVLRSLGLGPEPLLQRVRRRATEWVPPLPVAGPA